MVPTLVLPVQGVSLASHPRQAQIESLLRPGPMAAVPPGLAIALQDRYRLDRDGRGGPSLLGQGGRAGVDDLFPPRRREGRDATATTLGVFGAVAVDAVGDSS